MIRSRLNQVIQTLRPVLASNPTLQTASHELSRSFSVLARNSLPSSSSSIINRTPLQFLRRRQFSSEESDSDGRDPSSFNVQDFDDFQERVINSEVPVVVDFHADWCGPCKMLGPRLKAIVDEKDGKVLLGKVNIDDCGELAIDYGVTVVPTVLAFKDGVKQPEYMVGMKEDEHIQAFVDELAEG